MTLHRIVALLAIGGVVASCGGGGGGGGSSTLPPSSTGSKTHLTLGAVTQGVSPFIAWVDVQNVPLTLTANVNFRIHPGATDLAKPLSVTTGLTYLQARGFVAGNPPDGTVGTIHLPVFGLYAGQSNTADITVTYTDGSSNALTVTTVAPAYVDPQGVLDHMTIRQARTSSATIGFDYFYLKSGLASPVIVDTDGHLRWIASNPLGSGSSSMEQNGGFLIASQTLPDIQFIYFDGIVGVPARINPVDGAQGFDHDLEPGRNGVIACAEYGPLDLGDTALELDMQGNILHRWSFQQVVGDFMRTHGDDPSLFVRPPVDWFHLNTAFYDPSDNTLIVSSRENFVMKIDYDTNDIVWILGDTTKYWATFPSLRAKALTITGLGQAPIGQHSVKIAPDGSLLLFNDGAGSFNEPSGEPSGQSRPYALVSDYVIDPTAGTANNVWNYDHSPHIGSRLCSSARPTADGSVLVDYSLANQGSDTRVLGLDPSLAVVFDFDWPNPAGCQTAWYAMPIAMESMTIQ